jgi:hypothetical protein
MQDGGVVKPCRGFYRADFVDVPRLQLLLEEIVNRVDI